jgi:sensor domain CHASE-containing protein
VFRLFLITLTIAVFRKAFQMRKSASVTLTKKLALAVLTAALLLIPLTYLMMSFAVQPSFKQLEQVAVAQQEQRVQNAIEDFGKEVVRATRDYAVWDANDLHEGGVT